MAHTKAQLKKAARLGASLAPELLAMAETYRAEEAARLVRERERKAQEAADGIAKAALAAERAAFELAGLRPSNGDDVNMTMPRDCQPVVLLNTNAHPSALVATALARAERAQAFARTIERYEMMAGEKESQEGAFTLARMIEEVVDLLSVILDHKGVRHAPLSTMRAD